GNRSTGDNIFNLYIKNNPVGISGVGYWNMHKGLHYLHDFTINGKIDIGDEKISFDIKVPVQEFISPPRLSAQEKERLITERDERIKKKSKECFKKKSIKATAPVTSKRSPGN